MTNNKDYIIDCPPCFDLIQTFDCGQCFRFDQKLGVYEGVAYGKLLKVCKKEGKLIFKDCSEDDFKSIWQSFLSLDQNSSYEKLWGSFTSCEDETLAKAAKYGSGIRILRQEPWEALCSFIISQNNNIPRIKKIIKALCQTYGNKVEGFDDYYTFPSYETIAKLSESDLYALSMGFRAKYVLDAAKKVNSREIDLSKIADMPTLEASEYLQQIKGVGPKVALCTLLFGFAKLDAFPVDVWVKRVLDKYYKDSPSEYIKGEYAGIAQQYLFYYERCVGSNITE